MPSKGIQIYPVVITPEEVRLFEIFSHKLAPAFDVVTLAHEGWALSSASNERIRNWAPEQGTLAALTGALKECLLKALDEIGLDVVDVGQFLQVWVMGTLGYIPCPCGCGSKTIPFDWEVALAFSVATLEARRANETQSEAVNQLVESVLARASEQGTEADEADTDFVL